MYRNPDAPGLKPISTYLPKAMQSCIDAKAAIAELRADIAALECKRVPETHKARHAADLAVKRAQLARWEG